MYKSFYLRCAGGSIMQFEAHLILRLCILTLLSIATMSCIQTGAAAAAGAIDKIEPGVREKIQASGTLRVTVHLNVKKPQKLQPEEKQLHLEKIRAAQEALLAELAGTPHRVVRKFEIVPTMSLEVGKEALDILERSSLVMKVQEPRQLSPLR